MAVTYTRTNWQNGSNGNTPINAANLNNMEAGIVGVVNQSNQNATDIDQINETIENFEGVIDNTNGILKSTNGTVSKATPGVDYVAPDSLPQPSDEIPAEIAFTGSAGTSTEFSRADHVHPGVITEDRFLYKPAQTYPIPGIQGILKGTANSQSVDFAEPGIDYTAGDLGEALKISMNSLDINKAVSGDVDYVAKKSVKLIPITKPSFKYDVTYENYNSNTTVNGQKANNSATVAVIGSIISAVPYPNWSTNFNAIKLPIYLSNYSALNGPFFVDLSYDNTFNNVNYHWDLRSTANAQQQNGWLTYTLTTQRAEPATQKGAFPYINLFNTTCYLRVVAYGNTTVSIGKISLVSGNSQSTIDVEESCIIEQYTEGEDAAPLITVCKIGDTLSLEDFTPISVGTTFAYWKEQDLT